MLNKNEFRLCLMGLMLVSGCASQSTHTQAHDQPTYVNQTQLKTFVVPETMKPLQMKELYMIPDTASNANSTLGLALDIRPPSQIIPSANQTRLDTTQDTQYQIVIDVIGKAEDAVSQLTTAIDAYLAKQAIAYQVSDDHLSWTTDFIVHQTPSKTATFQQKYVVKIKPGAHQNMVYLAVNLLAHEVTQGAPNTVSPIEKKLHQTDMLNGIVRTWDQQVNHRRNVQLVNSTIQDLEVIFIQDIEPQNRWRIQAGFQQIWQLLPKALQRLNFKIEDLDYQKRKYYVKYTEEDGWFTSKTYPLANHKIFLFQVDPNPTATETDIQFLESDGQPVATDIAAKISDALMDALKQQARID